jgi:hypothetical protein
VFTGRTKSSSREQVAHPMTVGARHHSRGVSRVRWSRPH